MRRTEKYTTADCKPAVLMLRKIVALLNSGGGRFFIPRFGPGDARRQQNAVTEFAARSIRPAAGASIRTNLAADGRLQIDVDAGLRRPYYLHRYGITPSGVYVFRDGKVSSADAFEITQMITRTYGPRYDAMRSLRQDLTFSQAAAVFRSAGARWPPDGFSTLGITDPMDGEYTNFAQLVSDQCRCRTVISFVDEAGTPRAAESLFFEGSLLTQMEKAARELPHLIRQQAADSSSRRGDLHCEAGIRCCLLYVLANQDYRFQGSLRISVYPSRTCFRAMSDLLDRMRIGGDGKASSEASNTYLRRLLTRLPQARKALGSFRTLLAMPELARRLPTLELTGHTMNLVLPTPEPG